MAEYQLYCFAQSGNAYRAALMLNLIGADWQPVFVDFFKGGETRTPKYRAEVNEMGEVPVLAHGARKLSQSAVILSYLAEQTGRFKPAGEDARLEALRWIIFDNQKVNGFLGPRRRSCLATIRPSSISHSPVISIIRPKSSASTSPRSTRISAPGAIACARYQAGRILTI